MKYSIKIFTRSTFLLFASTLFVLNTSHGAENDLHRLIKKGDKDGAYQYVLKLYETNLKHPRFSKLLKNPEKLLSELNSKNESPLKLAIDRNLIPLALLIIDKLKTNDPDKYIQTKFTNSVYQGDLGLTSSLLKYKLRKELLDINYLNNTEFTPLNIATSNNNLAMVKILLNHGADPNQETSDGTPVLFFASFEGRIEIVKELLSHGANINHTDKTGHSALVHALYMQSGQTHLALQNKAAVAELLIDQGALITSNLSLGILLAAKTHRISLAEKLLAGGLNANYANNETFTPLIVASEQGNLELVKILLDHGANLNQEYSNGSTAILFAAQNGHLEIIKEFLNRGADINQINKIGQSALYYSLLRRTTLNKEILDRKAELAEFLLDHGVLATQNLAEHILWAAETNRTSLAKKLLNQGLDPNFLGRRRYSPLLIASEKGNIELVRVLLHFGANLEHQFENGSTALSFAAQNGHLETVKLLIELGANIEHRSNNRSTPLQWALNNKKIETALLLIENGADDSALNLVTKLQLAVSAKEPQYLRALIEQGQCSSFRDNSGNNCLHLATEFGTFEAIKLLIDANLDSDLKNKNGNTPIKKARMGNNLVGVSSLFYYPKIKSLNSIQELAALKFNLLADLSEAKLKNHEPHLDTLYKLKSLINKKGKQVYLEEKVSVLEETTQNQSRSHHAAFIHGNESLKSTECLICGDELTIPRDLPEGPAGCACAYCLECGKRFAETILESGGAELSKCPHCRDFARLEFIAKLGLPTEKLNSILGLQIQAYNQTLPGFRACPGIDCPGGAQVDTNESAQYTCLLCDFNGCLQCGDDHLGKCEAGDQANEDEIRRFLEEAQAPDSKIRDCYYCGKIVFRDDGCNDVICPECENHFHWIYGDHLKHPRWDEWKNLNNQVHDFLSDEKKYTSLGKSHY